MALTLEIKPAEGPQSRIRLQPGNNRFTVRVGDVVSIPKGSKIVFATPSRVKVFYVTFPASWASLQPRPQK